MINRIEQVSLLDLLKMIETPDYQRVVDDEYTTMLWNSILDDIKNNKQIFTNVVHVAVLLKNKKTLILDGQHRICVFKKLHDEFNINITIPVWFHNVNDEADAYTIFTKLNTNKPVSIFQSESHQIVISEVSKYLQSRYKRFIKTSEKPIGFNFNLDKLIAAFHTELKHPTCKKYYGSVEAASINDAIAAVCKTLSAVHPDDITWLGKSKLELLKQYRQDGVQFPEFAIFEHKLLVQILLILAGAKFLNFDILQILNNPVPTTLHDIVWRKHKHVCGLCGISVNITTFSVQYRIHKVFGGSANLDNLILCCRNCISGRGIEDL